MPLDKSICLIIVYFGEFPGYIRIFLEGCKRNKDIHWIIFHDRKSHIKTPENVRIITLSKSQFINLVKQKTGYDAKITHAYKLVDFKPLYGHLFEEYLHQYAFWGITDLDVIYGLIKTFITDDVLEKYDIITAYEEFLAGHFTIFRNIPAINTLYLKDPVIKDVIESSDPYVSIYDERSFDLLVREQEKKRLLRVYRKDLVLACTDERWHFEWHKNTVNSHQQYYQDLDEINKPLIDKSMKQRNYGPAYLHHGRLFHKETNTEHLYFHFKDWKEKLKTYMPVGTNYSNCSIDEHGICLLTGIHSIDRIVLAAYRIAKNFRTARKVHKHKAHKKAAIVTLADENYVEQAKQLFSSIYQNAGWNGDYVLLTPGIPEKEEQWFKERGVIIEKCKEFLTSEEKKRTDKEEKLNPVAFLKCCLFTEKFKQWKNIVYIDADTIVAGPLDELAEVQGFNAVRDYMVDYATPLRYQFMSRRSRPDRRKTILIAEVEKKVDLEKPAFNSGVMAFSTDIIEKTTFKELVQLAKTYFNVALYHDQGILNLYFYNQWSELPILYNFSPYYISIYVSLKAERSVDPNDERFNAVIYHFPSYENKPWIAKYHAYYSLWLKNYALRENFNKDMPNTPEKKVDKSIIKAQDAQIRRMMRERFHIIEGIFEEENDHGIKFRWMTKNAKVTLPEKEGDYRYFILKLFSPFTDLEQTIDIIYDTNSTHSITLLNGWHVYAIPKDGKESMVLRANKTLPKEVDERILAVRISTIETADDIPQSVIDTQQYITRIMHEKNPAQKKNAGKRTTLHDHYTG